MRRARVAARGVVRVAPFAPVVPVAACALGVACVSWASWAPCASCTSWALTASTAAADAPRATSSNAGRGTESDAEAAAAARLARVRDDPALANDPAAIEALARDADAFPPGPARVEARLLVAEAWLGRLRRPRAAIDELRKVTGDPGADPLSARLAEREIVDALVAQGGIDEAVDEARAHANRLDPRFVTQTERLVRRRALRRAAIVELAAFVTLAASAWVRARARGTLGAAPAAVRRIAPVAAAFAAYVGGVGGLLASRYEAGNAAPFLALGAVALPLAVVARAWSAVG